MKNKEAKNIKHYCDVLSAARDILSFASEQNVDGLRKFIFTEPQKPLFCTACGGSFSSMKYAAVMYSAFQGMGQALTPLTMSSVSDETLKNSKTLILSCKGKGRDIDYIRKRMLKLNPKNTAAISHINDAESENELQETFDKSGVPCFTYMWDDPGLFIDTTGVFIHYALLYKAFTNDDGFVSRLCLDTDKDKCYKYSCLRGDKVPKDLKLINHFVVIYSGWGEPVAYDFESKMTEAGYASVQLCDYRNFTHGRFVFMANHIDDAVLVMIKTPRDNDFVENKMKKSRSRHGEIVFPDDIQTITIETTEESALASLDLLFKMSVLFNNIGASHGCDPCNPKLKSPFQKMGPLSLLFKNLSKEHGLPLTNGIKQLL